MSLGQNNEHLPQNCFNCASYRTINMHVKCQSRRNAQRGLMTWVSVYNLCFVGGEWKLPNGPNAWDKKHVDKNERIPICFKCET